MAEEMNANPPYPVWDDVQAERDGYFTEKPISLQSETVVVDKILTYVQWRDKRVRERRFLYNCSKKSAMYGIVPSDWYRDEVIPKLNKGAEITPALAKSMKKNGVSLWWINKHYPDQWPLYLDLNGKVIKK
jgi:hypothetical protein